MAYRFQLSDLKRSSVRTIAGVCVDSDQFLTLANEVQRRLMRRGNWFDTEWLVKLCVYNRCIVWPRYVGTILGVKTCDGDVGDIKNKWYSIIGGASSLAKSYANGIYDYSGFGNVVFKDNNRVPTYNFISGNTGRLLRYYVKYNPKDIGKTITIYGRKFGGEALRHQDSSGNWVDGLVITSAVPYGTSPVLVTQIDSVVRDATQGECRLYEYDPDTDLLRDLALYEPNETNPRYRATTIENWCAIPQCVETTAVDGTDYDRQKITVEAIVKLAHYDLVNDNDFLLIDNFDAFKLAVQAVKLEEMNDDKNAEIKWMKAVKELNFELRDNNPDAQVAVSVNVLNGSSIYSPI